MMLGMNNTQYTRRMNLEWWLEINRMYEGCVVAMNAMGESHATHAHYKEMADEYKRQLDQFVKENPWIADVIKVIDN
jgi:hypothetical protein